MYYYSIGVIDSSTLTYCVDGRPPLPSHLVCVIMSAARLLRSVSRHVAFMLAEPAGASAARRWRAVLSQQIRADELPGASSARALPEEDGATGSGRLVESTSTSFPRCPRSASCRFWTPVPRRSCLRSSSRAWRRSVLV